MQRYTLFALAVVIACAPGGSSTAQSPQNPPPGMVRVSVAGHDLFVPTGFTVNLYADNLGHARNLVRGPDGSPYLAIQGGGRVVKLPDANGDGVADSVVTVATGL